MKINTVQLKMVNLIILLTLMLFSTANTFAQNTITKDGIIYNITNRTIGNQQVEVGNNKSCTLSEVVIPGSVKNNLTLVYYDVTGIGDSAFYWNDYLTSITIPSSVKSIGKYAFSRCFGLTSIKIPDGVRSIGDSAFSQLYITSIKIPKSVTSIGTGAFVECEKLTSITVDNNNTKYESPTGSNAIIEKSTNTLIAGCCNTIIPEGVKIIGNVAFNGSKITSISIPNGVESLVSNCFKNCQSLKSVTIPKSVTSIDDYAFAYDYGLESIQLNWDEPIKISTSCFEWIELSELTLYVPKGKISNYEKADVWKDFGKILESSFEYEGIWYNITDLANKTVEIEDNKSCILKEVEIPEIVEYNGVEFTVTGIGNKAFYGNNYLTSITIPSSVESIGKYAFSGCYRLTSITIPNGVKSIEDYAFKQLYITSIKIPKSVTSIGTGAFVECEKLTSITVDNNNTKYESPTGSNAIIEKSTNTLIAGCCNTIIPEGVKIIGNTAFDGSKITSISIPNGVESLVWSCFGNCKSLKTVTIPKSVKSIGDYVFAYDYDLESIQLNWDEPIKINTSCFERIELSELTLYVPKGKISNYEKADVWKDFGKISESSFEYEGIWYNITDLVNKTVEIEDNKSCKLKEVEIPEIVEYNGFEFTVTSIGESAFAGSSLESIAIPKSVKSIGDDAFAGCSKLTTIKLNWNNDILAFNSKWGIDLDKVTLYLPKDIADSYKTKGWECDNIKKMLKVTLSVNDEKCGEIKGNENVISGETEIYTAIPNTGYHFVQWDNGSTEQSRKITVNEDLQLTADFAINKYNVSLSIENGTLTGDGSGTYNYGDTIIIGAIPNDGYHFVEWSDNDYCDTREIIVTDNLELKAIIEAHIYSAPTIEWTDYSKAVATFVCSFDWDYQYIDGVITSDTTLAPTFEKEGELTYTATFTLQGKPYTDTKIQILEKLKNNGGEDPDGGNKGGSTAEGTKLTDIAGETANAVAIYAHHNTIVVENAEADIYVYDATGRCIEMRESCPSVEIAMQREGIYIVRTGDNTQRVFVAQN